MPTTRPHTTSRTEFAAPAVLRALVASGLLSPQLARSVRQTYAAKYAVLKATLKGPDARVPFVSPLEVVAAAGVPSRNPRRQIADEEEIGRAYCQATGLEFSRIDPLKLDARRLCTIVSKPFARTHLLVPIALDAGNLMVVMVNPVDRSAIQQLEDVTGFSVRPFLGLRNEILRTINEIFAFERSLMKAEALRTTADDIGNLEQLVELAGGKEVDASDRHIVNAVDLLLQYAFEQRASDIHIEPKRERAVVRLRIDGRLHDTHSISKHVYPSFISRIKVMARMDIAEKRRPQDGRIKSVHDEKEIELRISSVPVAFGEKIVIRIFDPSVLLQDLSSMGFFPEQHLVFERIIGRPHGIILVTGPTGSGKTTTLYSALRQLASPEVNITTIEDPIEMVYESFNQIGVREQAGVTFSSALRSILRQDPDIIMVGEIRDGETAQYAVQAALTGHLVLSTLHTNTAAGAITRLKDLGIEPYLIASTVVGIVAQRLVRTICPHCDEPARLSADEMVLLDVSSDIDLSGVRRGAGCEKCRKTGYMGRTAVFEVVELSDKMRALVRDSADEQVLTRTTRAAGAEALMKSAVRRLLAGRTTAEEILRVIPLSD